MIFLIEYERARGRIVTMRAFDDSEKEVAEETRLNLELDLNAKHMSNEVVLLEAASEEALRKTHRRYFEDLSQLLNSSATTSQELLNSRQRRF
jgi:wyosine [tRNA(Phe)-imidazoG37] synthetase (radical SAM superfamily)